MTTASIRQKLHNYLEVADDKKIKAIYTMIEAEVENVGLDYTQEIKNQLNERLEEYQSAKVEIISETESKKRIDSLFKKHQK